MEGFLVVLTEPEYISALKAPYRGIARVPGQPTSGGALPGEETAMDRYVFDPQFNDDDGLVSTVANARALLRMFDGSQRKFEVVYVRTTDCGDAPTAPPGVSAEFLGYDVAFVAPAESLIVEWPSSAAQTDFELNTRLLFDNCDDALRFREVALADEFIAEEYGTGIYVWEIHKVLE